MSARDLPSLPDFTTEKNHDGPKSRDWCDIHFPRKDVREAIHIITGEIKERGSKTAHVFLPFRRQSSDYSLKTFLQRIFIEGEISSRQVVEKVVSRTDEFTLIAALKFFWCRLPGNCVVGWKAYEKFAYLEKEQRYPQRAFLDIMPQCLSSPAHASIVYDFLDLLVALSSHSRENKLSGRKISRVSGIWAFNGPRKDTGCDVSSFQIGMLSWLPASDAMFHLLVSFLRSMLPSDSSERQHVAKSLTSLVSNTSYPPHHVTLSPKTLMEVVSVTLKSGVLSKTPMELLSRMGKALDFKDPNKFYSKEDYILLKTLFKDPENIRGKLSAENRRILDEFSLADQDLVCTEEEDGVNCVLQPGWLEPSYGSDVQNTVSVEVGRTLLDDYFVWAWLCSVSSEATIAKKCQFGRSFILEAELGEGYKKWVVIEEQDVSLESCLEDMRVKLDPRQKNLRELEKELKKHNEQGLPPLPKPVDAPRSDVHPARMNKDRRVQSPKLNEERIRHSPKLDEERIRNSPKLDKERIVQSTNLDKERRMRSPKLDEERRVRSPKLDEERSVHSPKLDKERRMQSPRLDKQSEWKNPLSLKMPKKSPKVKVSSSFKEEKLPAIPPTPPAIPDKDSVYLGDMKLPEIEPEEFKIELSDLEGDDRFNSSAISIIEPLQFKRKSPEISAPAVPPVPSAPSVTSSIEDLKRMVDAATLEATISPISAESKSIVSDSKSSRSQDKAATPKRKPPPRDFEREKELPKMPVELSKQVQLEQVPDQIPESHSSNNVSQDVPLNNVAQAAIESHPLQPLLQLQPDSESIRPDSVGTHYYSAVESPEKRNSNNRMQLYDDFDQLENDLRDYINQPEPVENHTTHSAPQHYPQQHLSPQELPPRTSPPRDPRHARNENSRLSPYNQPSAHPSHPSHPPHPSQPTTHYGSLPPPQSHHPIRGTPSPPSHYYKAGPPRQASPSYASAPRFAHSPPHPVHQGPYQAPRANYPPSHAPQTGYAMSHPAHYKNAAAHPVYGPAQRHAHLVDHPHPSQQYEAPASGVPQTKPTFRNKAGAKKDLRNAITQGNFGL